MRGVNKVILIGNLGRDPEVRYTASGQAVANFTLATTEPRVTKEGNREDITEWHRVVAWGKLAEICGEYLTKGKMVYIEGSLRTRSWDDKGTKRYTTEVVARTMQMLSSAGDRSSSGGDKSQDMDIDDGGFSGTDDDIPF